MTLKEWTAEVIEDFQAAGYTVTEYQGFPLVEMPTEGTIQERAKLIKFQGGRWAVDKTNLQSGHIVDPSRHPRQSDTGRGRRRQAHHVADREPGS